MPVVSANELERLAAAILHRLGAPGDIAGIVAESLVEANLLGHDSHGVIQLLRYASKVAEGSLQPAARATVRRRQGATATVDGGWGFGHPAAHLAVATAAPLAAEFGIAAVVVERVNHVGRLGEYVEALAAAGQIGIATAAGAGRGGSVAPFGGRERIFGTNPIAIAVPVPSHRPPLVIDFATAAIAAGKIDIALAEGKPLPEGVLLDAAGVPTTDPAAFAAGGALLPFGGHKGSGLMLMIELVTSVLAGFAPASSTEWQPGNPALLIALAVDAFTSRERFARLTEELLHRVESSAPAEGVAEVLLPGALEARTRAKREREGIPVPEPTWRQLIALRDGDR
ncbi:MAG: dehydrogenase [Dehalococcoidia bacterium]|jgi:uncharacterized oxidoreductase|nr:MAG: dehydrogenase [Dehalococcoidia bacterium]